MAHLPTLLIRPDKIIILSWLLIFAASARENPLKNPQPLKDNNILHQKAGLLGVRLDFTDGKLTDWNHKDNAKLSILEDSGKNVLHFESRFEPYTFTWTTYPFAPTTVEGVAHVRFRLRSDGSGHKLHVNLGAQRPGERHTLYYQNTKQTVLLDSNGWRSVTLDLDQFDTPAGGLREQDFTHITFIQFMVTASDAKKPLDIALDEIEFTGRTEAELAAIEKHRQEREQTISEMQSELTQTRKELDRIRDQLDSFASQNKYVNISRVYWTALEWCHNDIQRCLQAEELEIVQQAKSLMTDLKKRLSDQENILKHVLDNAPVEDDPFHAEQNPYFKSVIKVAEGASRKETVYAKGHKGYLATSNAWSFASFGNALFDAAWSLTTPQSTLRHHPVLLANALNLLDLIAHQHTEGDYNVNRTAIYGYDPNINRFCLAPTLDAWYLLSKSYPNLLPPAKQADIESGLKQLVEFQRKTYGLERLEKNSHEKFPAYPNMDVHHILIMEFAHRFWGDPEYAHERDAFVKILDSAVFPMGAFTYINTQNECFVYHHLNVVYSARYWKLSGNPITLTMLKRTIPFYPHNVEPAGMPEYYTDACWKHYWGGGGADGPDVIAALFDDPLNKRVAEICGEIWGFGHGYMSAITAEFWKPLPSKPLPDNYVINDTNIEGPRGRYGVWSFAGNGRNYGVGYQGKDTFVGAMITSPTNRPMPLDSALQVVTTEVRLNNTDNHWKGGRSCSALEKLTTTCGSDFGTLAVRYTVSRSEEH
ncbi:MAG: hypothetical protein PHR77_22380, partial [Kiritimatiellae bacterium]|nr:hypothetical protein [Kiritimatiellia bacterium]